MMTDTERMAPAPKATEIIETPSTQQVALSLLLAEMTALSAMIPGLQPQGLRSEAEVEADFDNMPV